MAIYHFSAKSVSRSSGRSATGAAAYRSGKKIVDLRTGMEHDYTRRDGVESADIVLPDGAPAWALDRSALWNAAELAERRKDACVAREFEVALPVELSPEERRQLALDFAQGIANAEGCAVDVAIHSPGKEGDNRNHHAHILRTTRKVEAEGLGDKLDSEKAGRNRKADLEALRVTWADMTNERLSRNGIAARVDHRSLEEQGIERLPTIHLGPAASEMERRNAVSDRGDVNRAITANNVERGELASAVVIDLDTKRLERMDDAQLRQEVTRRKLEPFESIAQRHPLIAPTVALADRALKGIDWCTARLKSIGVRWEKHMDERRAAGGLMTSVQRFALRAGAAFGAVKASEDWLGQQQRMKARTERVLDLRQAQIRKLASQVQGMAEQLRPEIEAEQVKQLRAERRVLFEIEHRKTKHLIEIERRRNHVNTPEVSKAVREAQQSQDKGWTRGGGRGGGRGR